MKVYRVRARVIRDSYWECPMYYVMLGPMCVLSTTHKSQANGWKKKLNLILDGKLK